MVLHLLPVDEPELKLWLVGYKSQEGDLWDQFITAPTQLEAFVVWRMSRKVELLPEPTDEVATVYPVPVGSRDRIMAHDWEHDDNGYFNIHLDDLTTQAIETYVRNKTKE